MTRLAPFATLALLAACGTPDTDTAAAPSVMEAEGQQLERALSGLLTPPVVTGCSDISVQAAANDDGTAIFLTTWAGHVEAATFEGGPTSIELTLPDPDVDLTVQWGSDLTINACDDVMMGTPVVDGEATAIAGTVYIDLELLAEDPQVWDMSANAAISMEDVVFETPSGAQRTYDVELGTVGVGWFPG